MPTTISSTSGTSYHLFQLPNLCAPEPEFGIGFTTIDNEMCLGYRSSSLLGLNTGVRTFKLTLPTISAYGTSYTDPYGNSVVRHAYLRNLFKYNQTTGIPFAYQHPDTEQYYLVDFADSELPMQKVKGAMIFQTNIELRQRRINGETIFQVTDEVGHQFDEGTHNFPSAGDWGNNFVLGKYLTATGGVTFGANPQNGMNTVRLNGTSGYLSQNFSASVDVIMAVKYRAATFSNNGGLFCGASNIIRGTSGGTKWQNPSITGLEYALNARPYAVTDMQAPMDTWGVCHWRFPSGVDITTFGKDTGTAYLAVDIGELIIADGGLTIPVAREVAEYLMMKWGVTA